jgi:hypothetical protein
VNRDFKVVFVAAAASLLACTVGKDGKQGDPGVPCSGCVSAASLAPGAVGSAALGDGAVKTPNIAASAVTGAQIADGAVSTTKLAAGAVDNNALGAASVTSATVADGAILNNHLGAAVVTGANIAAGTITGANIANASVPGSAIDPATAITAGNFLFAAPKLRQVGVQSYAFVPQNNGITWDGAALAGNGFRAMTGGGPLVMAAPIAFPDGAILQNLIARVFDGSTTLHVTVYLRRFDGLGATTIVQTGTTDAEVGGFLTKSTAFTHTVDNNGVAAYFLIWEMNGAGTVGGGPGLYSASVDYVYTSP